MLETFYKRAMHAIRTVCNGQPSKQTITGQYATDIVMRECNGRMPLSCERRRKFAVVGGYTNEGLGVCRKFLRQVPA
jgi:hypothetical protein